jgi:hypothetical protein
MQEWQILLFVALFALLRWILRSGGLGKLLGSGDEGRQPPTSRQPTTRAKREETEEERVRKFMEALGVPPAEAPPRRVTSPARKAPTEARRGAQRRVVQKPAYVPQPAPRPAPVAPAVEPEPEPVERQEAASFAEPSQMPGKLKPVTTAVPARSPRSFDLKNLLASADSIRSAVILREVLGPPRGLQSHIATPNVL